MHSDIYIYEPSFLPGLEGPRKGRARRPHAHRPHLSDTKCHSRGPWKANGLHSTAHTGEYGFPKPYEWRHVRHQTGCGRHQTPAVWNAPVTEARGSGIWVGDRWLRSGVLGRSDGDAELSDHDFYPGNGTSTHTRDAVVPSAGAVTIAQDHGFSVADFASLRAIQRSSQILPDVHHLYALLRSR